MIVFTKSDKNKPGATLRHVKMFVEGLQEYWEETPPYFVTSALTKEGRDLLLSYVGDMNQQFVLKKA